MTMTVTEPGTAAEPAALLSVSGLTVSYGGIRAVKGISFDVFPGEIVALVGANGAGKSSTLRAVSGLHPWEGIITYQGRELVGVPAHEIVARGLAHVPEGRRIFGNLTVKENLKIATWQRKGPAGSKAEIRRDLATAFDLFPILGSRRDQPAVTLSGGEQQMLAISRALMSRPTLLLLDEPSMGLAPKIVAEIFSKLADLNRQGMTLLLVEQNATMALRVATKAYLMEVGTITLSGPAKEVLEDARVVEAYLGPGGR